MTTPEQARAALEAIQAIYMLTSDSHDLVSIRIRARCREAAALLEPVGEPWQPIETAPKDGTSVLVAGRHNYVGQARFVDRDWYEANNDPGDAWGGPLMPPSHWMPLPPAPTDPREGGEK
jgi:hypothetical protein